MIQESIFEILTSIATVGGRRFELIIRKKYIKINPIYHSKTRIMLASMQDRGQECCTRDRGEELLY